MKTELSEIVEIWALDADGKKIHGFATGVGWDSDLPEVGYTWGADQVSQVRATQARHWVDFIDGRREVQFYTSSEELLDALIGAEQEAQRKAEIEYQRRRRAEQNRVTVDDLVGRFITKVQMNEEVLIFTLDTGDVWAFKPTYGEWSEVKRPWILTNGATVTKVESECCIRVFTDRDGYRTISAVIDQEYDLDEDYFAVSLAFVPTRQQLEETPVISGY